MKSIDSKNYIITSIASFLMGIASFILSIYLEQNEFSTYALISMVCSLLFVSYGGIVLITSNIVRSLFFPAIALLIVVLPIFIAGIITNTFVNTSKAWIHDLSVAAILICSFTIYFVFMIKKLFGDQRKNGEYIKVNKENFLINMRLNTEGFAIIKNRKKDIAKIEKLSVNKYKVIINKTITNDNKAETIVFKTNKFYYESSAFCFALQNLNILDNDDRPYVEFANDENKKHVIDETLAFINDKLTKEHQIERGSLNEFDRGFGKEYKIIISHLYDTKKDITITYDGEFCLCFLEAEYYFNDSDEFVNNQITEVILGILTNKIFVTMNYTKLKKIAIIYNLDDLDFFPKKMKRRIKRNDNVLSWSRTNEISFPKNDGGVL